jgi:hypothetical protein
MFHNTAHDDQRHWRTRATQMKQHRQHAEFHFMRETVVNHENWNFETKSGNQMKQTKANAAINSMAKDIPLSFTVENTGKRACWSSMPCVRWPNCSVTANANVTNAIIEPIMNNIILLPKPNVLLTASHMASRQANTNVHQREAEIFGTDDARLIHHYWHQVRQVAQHHVLSRSHTLTKHHWAYTYIFILAPHVDLHP